MTTADNCLSGRGELACLLFALMPAACFKKKSAGPLVPSSLAVMIHYVHPSRPIILMRPGYKERQHKQADVRECAVL